MIIKFLIEYTDNLEQKTLIYNSKDCSFGTEPSVQEINFDIVLNRLNLTAIDIDNKINQLWGMPGYNKWIKFNDDVPVSHPGILKVIDNLEYGLAYKVNKDDLPVYVNPQTGWICIGNPKNKGKTVEFINNCIAVINNDNELISLWLRPKILPDI